MQPSGGRVDLSGIDNKSAGMLVVGGRTCRRRIPLELLVLSRFQGVTSQASGVHAAVITNIASACPRSLHQNNMQ